MNKKLKSGFFLLALAILLSVVAVGCSQRKSDRNTRAAKVAGSERAVTIAADSAMNSLMTATT